MLHVSVKKYELSNILGRIQTIVDKKTTMVILNNALLYTDKDNLFVEATDLEISYRGKIDCSILQEGAITIDARKFFEIVKEFPSDEIHIEEDENLWLTIGGGDRARYKISGLRPDDFPRFRELPCENAIDIAADDLKQLIERTIFSVSSDESKFSLAGIFVEAEGAGESGTLLRMVSSDGHRLTIMEKLIHEGQLNLDGGIIVPRKGANEIRKLLEGHERVTFGVGKNLCYLNTGTDHLVVRLVDGKFPDYRSIVPATRDRVLIFDRIALSNALKRMSILAVDTGFRGVRASVTQHNMKIESLYRDIGEAREILDVTYNGPPFDLAFNAKYVIDALGVMRSREVEMISNSDVSPCLLIGQEDPGFSALVMPISIAGSEVGG